MARILILFAHPALEKSRVQSRLLRKACGTEGITFHDLYELYPDFDIDVKKEQQLLLEHDIIIWQHPFYWYSCPAIIKQWMDLVLEHGWAYGSTGKKLRGKKVFNILSAGGSHEAYCSAGRNRYTINQLLAPFKQTASLCNMDYLPPFAILGTHKLVPEELDRYAIQYQNLLIALRDEQLTETSWQHMSFLNDLVPDHQTA